MAASNSSAGGGAGAASGRFGESAPAATLTPEWGDTICRLRLLSKLKPGCKLSSQDFSLYQPGFISWARRKWAGDSAAETVRLLRDFYGDLVTDLAGVSDGAMVARIRTLVRESVAGLEALLETYTNDPVICSQLEYLIHDVIGGSGVNSAERCVYPTPPVAAQP